MRTKRSIDVLRDKSLYRSIAFTRKERIRLGLQGLLPHAVATEPQLVDRVIHSLRQLPRDIDRYMALSSMQERNERLFYRTVIDHVEEIMPWIYTPTVGEACREFSHIVREPKGFFITPADRGASRRFSTTGPRRTSGSSSSQTVSASSVSAIWAQTEWEFPSASSRSTRRAPAFRRSIACRC